MKFVPHCAFHVFNQGNNRQAVFFSEDNYAFFFEKMRIHLMPYADILAYCLMPNHFHWLIVPRSYSCQMQPNKGCAEKQVLSHQIGILLSSYSRAVNVQEERSGSLFRAKTKAKTGWITEGVDFSNKMEYNLRSPEDQYAHTCFEYIHQNPVKAGLTGRPEDWPHSSAGEYYGYSEHRMCNKEMAAEYQFYLMADPVGRL
jgi:putative transposase